METTAKLDLKQQLRDRLAAAGGARMYALCAGPFGTGESRKDYEKRIMETEDAWTNMNPRTQGILPR
jgi:methylmalonyl-CoA mutase cobalamin-binding subunit